MSWFSRKKKEEKKPTLEDVEMIQQGIVNHESDKGEDSPNLIYRGPMSGMSEAIKKFNETGEKTGDIREWCG